MADAAGNTVIDRLFDALASGDLDAARDCFTPNAQIWHNFDRIVQDRDALLLDWQKLISVFSKREIHDIRRQATPDGFFQQHVFVMSRNGAPPMAWPICIVVRTEGDHIVRLEEYIDRAGSFSPDDGPVTTPSL